MNIGNNIENFIQISLSDLYFQISRSAKRGNNEQFRG